MNSDADIAIIGTGAAGLMAAIHAGRAAPAARRIVALDSARSLGAKILIAGGGRCNVTHHAVDETAYAGSSRNSIRNVVRRFDVPQTIAFFRELGVELKREDTGKLFPVTDRARTVLDALLKAARDARAEIRHPWRVQSVHRENDQFFLTSDDGRTLTSRVLIMATGGRSLPKTGSDGHGYVIARSLGHSITQRVFPALVPLKLPANHFICSLSGITFPATLEVRSGSGKPLASFTNSTLCTHFGLSGPSVLDISRYLIDARLDDPRNAALVINFIPNETFDTFDRALLDQQAASLHRALAAHLPDRLADALIHKAQLDPSRKCGGLTRDERQRLVQTVIALELPITGDRGYTFAEATAGGVPLSELHLKTLESRVCPNLYLCGEICDVDGRIGGFNFQWAWASGFVAGTAAAKAIETRE